MTDQKYRGDLKAHVVIDDDGRARHILHTDERWFPEQTVPRLAAIEYVRKLAPELKVGESALDRLHERLSFSEPRQDTDSYRLEDEKRHFDSTTVAFAQTYLNVPVWRTGITVTVKDGPTRIVESTNTTLADVKAALPSGEAIEKWRQVIEATSRRVVETGEIAPATTADRLVREALGLVPPPKRRASEIAKSASRAATKLRVGRARFFVYRYDPAQRQPRLSDQPTDVRAVPAEADDVELTFPLPAVPRTLRTGGDYLVVEVVFSLPFMTFRQLNWRALIDVETGAVLYLRALIAGVNALVFRQDPITKTGVLTNTATQTNAVLNPLRDDVTLHNLNAPAAGAQSLVGSRVQIADDDAPAVAAPTQPAGNDFDYDARTNNFAAVSAYYGLATSPVSLKQ